VSAVLPTLRDEIADWTRETTWYFASSRPQVGGAVLDLLQQMRDGVDQRRDPR